MVAEMRKAPKRKPHKLMTFTTTMTPHKALKSIIEFALQGGYKIDDFTEAEGHIILSDLVSLTSFGFFYPIYVSMNNSGSTLVEVGIKGKASIVGTIGLRHQERCFNGIKATIFAQT